MDGACVYTAVGGRVDTRPAEIIEKNQMKIGIIGLGRMGGGIAYRLMRVGHHCVVYDRDATIRNGLVKKGATAVGSVQELVNALD